MTYTRRSDHYKQFKDYVPLEIAQKFKSMCDYEGLCQSEVLKEMIGEWLAKKDACNSSNSESANQPTTIADLVRANMKKLKRSGLTNLQALAEGEVLPTPGEFAIITSILGIAEEEQKIIWQQTFVHSSKNDYRSDRSYEDDN